MTFEERFYALKARGLELDEQQAALLACVDMEPALFDRALALIRMARQELDQELRQLRAEMVAAGWNPHDPASSPYEGELEGGEAPLDSSPAKQTQSPTGLG